MLRTTFLGFWFLLALALNTLSVSSELHFRVRSISNEIVVLESDSICSAGTLVSFIGASGAPITLRIIRRTGTGNYLAMGFTGDTSKLVVGEDGETSSPVYSSSPMRVTYEGEDPSTERTLKTDLGNSVLWIDSKRQHADVSIEKMTGLKRFVLHDAVFDYDESVDFNEFVSGAKLIASSINAKLNSHYWIGLENHFWERGPQTGNTIVRLMVAKGVTARGTVIRGSEIFLQAVSTIDGYVCLLEPEKDGSVTVIYPRNGVDINKHVNKSESFVVNEISGVRLTASTSGPTFFVLLVSAVPRALAEFLPACRGQRYSDIHDKPVDPRSIGPGVFAATGQSEVCDNDYSVDDLIPDSWDIGHIAFGVEDK
jgi:hypothetical protein